VASTACASALLSVRTMSPCRPPFIGSTPDVHGQPRLLHTSAV
jgi:hypothetical protein